MSDEGVWLTGETAGERWWSTRAKWRAGSGRWSSVLLVDVHPTDTEAVHAALRQVVKP